MGTKYNFVFTFLVACTYIVCRWGFSGKFEFHALEWFSIFLLFLSTSFKAFLMDQFSKLQAQNLYLICTQVKEKGIVSKTEMQRLMEKMSGDE